MPEELSLQPFEPLTAGADEWVRMHAFRHARHAETRPDDPPYPDDLAVKESRAEAENPDYVSRQWVVGRGDRLVASLWAGWRAPGAPGYESSRHIAHVGIHVLGPERRKGIGTALVRQALAATADTGHTVLSAGAEEDSGHAFLRWLGFEERIKGAENRLDLKAVDWEMVEDWARRGATASPVLQLQFLHDRVPENLLTPFCALRTELLNAMPFDELEHGDIVVTEESLARELYRWLDDSRSSWHCAVAVGPDGTMSGMTDVAFIPAQPDRIQQFLTGVQPSSQGHGLGKWLKAAMMLFVRERYPEVRWIVTGNASSNAPMLAINRRLGFKEHRANSGYQIERAKLAEFLGEQ